MVKQWSDLLDLTLKYGNTGPLTTDYNTQVTMNGMSPEFAAAIQACIGGKKTKEGMFEQFQENWNNLSFR